MTALPPELGGALEAAAARCGSFGHRAVWYPEIGSTNDVALALAAGGDTHLRPNLPRPAV